MINKLLAIATLTLATSAHAGFFANALTAGAQNASQRNYIDCSLNYNPGGYNAQYCANKELAESNQRIANSIDEQTAQARQDALQRNRPTYNATPAPFNNPQALPSNREWNRK